MLYLLLGVKNQSFQNKSGNY